MSSVDAAPSPPFLVSERPGPRPAVPPFLVSDACLDQLAQFGKPIIMTESPPTAPAADPAVRDATYSEAEFAYDPVKLADFTYPLYPKQLLINSRPWQPHRERHGY